MSPHDWQWALPYTSHLGYLPPARRPLFAASLGTADLPAHVHHAAALGFAGVLFPWAIEHPAPVVDAVGQALRATGLRASAVVCTPRSLLLSDVWVTEGSAARECLEAHVRNASRVARVLGSTILAAVPLIAARTDRERGVFAAHLRTMADVAAEHGLTIGLEPMKRTPAALVGSIIEAVDLIGAVGRANVGVVFDTGHVAATDGSLTEALGHAWDHVCLVQLADLPGRVEPGAGELDLVELGASVLARGYSGLVDLEHAWLGSTQEDERRGLARIRDFDAQVRRRGARAAAGDG